MSPRARILLVVAILTVLVVGASLAAYAAWHREGVIQVEVSSVDGWGSGASIQVPAALVPIALEFLPDVRMGDCDRELAEAHRYMPLVNKVWREMRDGPDGLWVAVDSRHERVRISKESGYLYIDVLDGNEHVQVKCPVRTVDAVTQRMTRMSRSWI